MSFQVPAVPRGLLLPGLDTYELREEELPTPTPPGSHWLFRPPPFISWADCKAETVNIENPSAWTRTSLDGYTLSDGLRRHTYHFPKGCSLPARRSLTLYCCPGKLPEGAVANLPRNVLLWKNQDGSLRKKEVVDSTGETLVLADKRGKEVAVLEIPCEDDDKGRQMKRLPGVKRARVLALRTLVLSLCYLRLTFTGLAAAWVTVNPDVFLLFTGLAHVTDFLSRCASSQPGAPMDGFAVVLATTGDRLTALILLGSLVLLDSDPRHCQIFAGMLALDITANWLQLSVASSAGGPDPLAGGVLVRGKGSAAPDFLTHLMLSQPLALTLVSLGNEAFLLWSYIVASSPLPPGLGMMAARAGGGFSSLFRWLSDAASSPGGEMAVKAGASISSWFTDAVSFVLSVYSSPSPSSSPSAEEATSPQFLFAGETDAESAGSGRGEVGGGFGYLEPTRFDLGRVGLEDRLVRGSDGGGAEGIEGASSETAAAAATVWKAVWMALMVCCAVRQLLSCIQVLISMSTLSSGVITNAAGQDLQRCKPRTRRGRTVENGGGVGGTGSRDGSSSSRSNRDGVGGGGGRGGSSSVLRARSRSRIRLPHE